MLTGQFFQGVYFDEHDKAIGAVSPTTDNEWLASIWPSGGCWRRFPSEEEAKAWFIVAVRLS